MRCPHVYIAAVAAIGLAGLLGGCARSGATRYYTLAALAPVDPVAATPDSIGVGPVRLAPYLRQDGMVTRVEPQRLQYSDFSLWAEAPEDAVAEVLRENLGRLSGAAVVQRYPWRLEDAPTYQVAVEITAFELAPEGDAVLTARWEVRDAHGTLVHRATASYREPAKNGLRSLAEALSRALLRLARDLAPALAP